MNVDAFTPSVAGVLPSWPAPSTISLTGEARNAASRWVASSAPMSANTLRVSPHSGSAPVPPEANDAGWAPHSVGASVIAVPATVTLRAR